MKFFKNKESTPVKSIRAVRAVIDIHTRLEMVDVEFINSDGEKLTLNLTPSQAGKLSVELGHAYEAINPPLTRGGRAAEWQGME
jgi:hypothetical protein